MSTYFELALNEASDRTGFDHGERFETEAQVREYFTPGEQRRMFGEDAITDVELLDYWADAVLATGCWCTPELQERLCVLKYDRGPAIMNTETITLYEIGQSAGREWPAEFKAVRATLLDEDPEAIATTDLGGAIVRCTIVDDDDREPITVGDALDYLDRELGDEEAEDAAKVRDGD